MITHIVHFDGAKIISSKTLSACQHHQLPQSIYILFARNTTQLEKLLYLRVVREGIEDRPPCRIKAPKAPPMVNRRSLTCDVESNRRIGGFQADEGLIGLLA